MQTTIKPVTLTVEEIATIQSDSHDPVMTVHLVRLHNNGIDVTSHIAEFANQLCRVRNGKTCLSILGDVSGLETLLNIKAQGKCEFHFVQKAS